MNSNDRLFIAAYGNVTLCLISCHTVRSPPLNTSFPRHFLLLRPAATRRDIAAYA